MRSLSWVNFVLGLWLIVAPFALQYRADTMALWNNVIVGIVVAILSVIRALEHTNISPLQHRSVH